MEGSPANDGERRARRTGVLLGALGVLVLALGIALAVVLLSGDDDDGSSEAPAVTATTATTQTTVTATQPPTQTVAPPTEATITQAQARAAAAQTATDEASKGGIGIPTSDWDVRCTAAGGGPRAVRWTCQVASSSGQCSGTIVAYARAPDVAATTDPRIACGE